MRWLAAGVAVLAYLLLCAAVGLLRWPGRRHHDATSWIVAYASQTGSTEELAQRSARLLQLAGVNVELLALSELTMPMLREASRVLFAVSTYGEGDPPDNAALFCRDLMQAGVKLDSLHYTVLAMGDDNYANYCGFGRALDLRLQQLGAQALFDRIEVNCGDAAALGQWQQCLGRLVGTSDLPEEDAPRFAPWRLVRRHQTNPGSLGEPVFHLELSPQDGKLPPWQSGDLAQILVPGDARPREYSIASLPADGHLHLLIRLHRRPDGSTGLASDWLCRELPEGAELELRVREHRRFRLDEASIEPLILIGNGTGMAGLRSHLKARLARGLRENWLLFGERQAACDYHYGDEIARWQHEAGLLVDTAFSRDQQERIYVQDRLQEQGERLREWIGRGAAIYVCGSLKGMAAGVDAALAKVLGAELLEQLSNSGRYRRDVY